LQAEDGIRDPLVTGVQRVLFRSVNPCGSGESVINWRYFKEAGIAAMEPARLRRSTASSASSTLGWINRLLGGLAVIRAHLPRIEIGRASCRERRQLVRGWVASII